MTLIERLIELENRHQHKNLKSVLANPMKHFIAYLAREEPIMFPGGTYRQSETYFGKDMWVCLPSGEDIFLYGAKLDQRDFSLSKYLLSLDTNITFLDVGAYYGYYSLLVSTLSADNQVHSFEPSKDNYKLLYNNVMDQPQIKSHRVALYDTKGTAEFHTGSIKNSRWNSLIKSDNHIDTEVVPIHTLDVYCRQNEIEPSVILIDIGGSDISVIKGARRTIDLYKPIVIQRSGVPHLQSYIDALDLSNYTGHKISISGSLEPISLSDDHASLMTSYLVFLPS